MSEVVYDVPFNSDSDLTFDIDFTEFVPMLDSVEALFIGDGTSEDIQETIDPQTGEKVYSGGTAGYLYAKYHGGYWQSLGFVSDYEKVKSHFAEHGISITYDDWIDMLIDISEAVPITNNEIVELFT